MLSPDNNRCVLPLKKPRTEILFAQLQWNEPDAPGAPVAGASSPRKSVAELWTWHRPSKFIPARVGSLNVFPCAMCSFPITQYIDSGTDEFGILLPLSLTHVEKTPKPSYVIFAFDSLRTCLQLLKHCRGRIVQCCKFIFLYRKGREVLKELWQIFGTYWHLLCCMLLPSIYTDLFGPRLDGEESFQLIICISVTVSIFQLFFSSLQLNHVIFTYPQKN